jgi:uncharacterized repeat protein (TIGR01451 family)
MASRISGIALPLCALLIAGCGYGRVARIDPTGEHVFVPVTPQPGDPLAVPVAAPPAAIPTGRVWEQPGGQLPRDDVSVSLTPRVVVAPIDSEVVLLAAVAGPDGYLRTNRRLEWTITPGCVGHFVDIGRSGWCDWLVGDFNAPRKVDATYAVGSTSRHYLRLTRGTPTPEDDVMVLSGQGWVSVTSPIEGSSHVTVLSPSVYGWNARTQSATIHWIDAQWAFPPPAINPAGTRHTFATSVMRHSDQCPCVGWSVRYEILDGPAAGFAPEGGRVVEVTTDPAGQARAEIFQKAPAPGTNRVGIQIVRPGTLPGADGRRLVVGNGSTMKTWTAAALSLRKSGPAVAGVGAVLTFRSQITNPGDQPARDIVLVEQVPEGLTYVGSTPPAEVAGRTLRWRLPPLGGGQCATVDVNYRADRQGSVNNCAEVTAAGGLRASDCAASTISTTAPSESTPPGGAAPLQLSVTGPQQANVGESVTFDMLVANRGPTVLRNVKIKVSFGTGLQHAVASPIQRLVGDLQAGESQTISVTFKATQPGSQCANVELTADGGLRAAQTACVTAMGSAATVTPPPAAFSVTVKPESSSALSVGDTAEFTIDLYNRSDRALANLNVVVQYDPNLAATVATAGAKRLGSGLTWTIKSLAAGAATELQLICRGESAAPKACVHVTVSGTDGSQAEDQCCLAVKKGPGGAQPAESPPGKPPEGGNLTLKIKALNKQPPVGTEMAFDIRVTNDGKEADRLVSVVVNVPAALLPVRLGTMGPNVQASFAQQAVRFDPAPTIAPGETLAYRVRVRAKQAGNAKLKVEVTSLGQPRAVTKEETVKVVDK